MSQTLTPEEKQRIIKVLQDRKVKTTCPMCGNNNFILADGFFNNPVQTNYKNLTIGGPTIPTIATFCSNCGFVSQHALGVLGLLEPGK